MAVSASNIRLFSQLLLDLAADLDRRAGVVIGDDRGRGEPDAEFDGGGPRPAQ
jgi:hypothetical protein